MSVEFIDPLSGPDVRAADPLQTPVLTTGTGLAYVLTDSRIGTPVDGQVVAFRPHVACSANSTVAINGATAANLRYYDAAFGQRNMANNQLPAGTTVIAKFETGSPNCLRVISGFSLDQYSVPSHSHAAGDITSGTLALARGGLATSLAATGGSGFVIKQKTAGGTPVVEALVPADMPGKLKWIAQLTGTNTVSASETILGWGTPTVNTLGATYAAGVITMPVAGTYLIESAVGKSGSAITCSLIPYVGSTAQDRSQTTTLQNLPHITKTVGVAAGGTIKMGAIATAGGSGDLDLTIASGINSYLSITQL